MQVTFVKPTLGPARRRGPFVDAHGWSRCNWASWPGLTPPGVDGAPPGRPHGLDRLTTSRRTSLAITVEAFTARRAYEIAAESTARARVPVVIGGMHATLILGRGCPARGVPCSRASRERWWRRSSSPTRTMVGCDPVRTPPWARPSRRARCPARTCSRARATLPLTLLQFGGAACPLRVLCGGAVLRPPPVHASRLPTSWPRSGSRGRREPSSWTTT